MRILIFGVSDLGSRLFKRFSCSTLVNMTFILLIYVKNVKNCCHFNIQKGDK